jgi:uncharacterized membrane protein (UPF0182 family)
VIAFSRPFWPLFLHVLGAMILFGCVLTTTVAAGAALRAPRTPALRRAAFLPLVAALPAWVLMRAAAQWIYADEKDVYSGAAWVGIGFGVADLGLLLLLAALGAAYWWQRSATPAAGRILAVCSLVYLLLLAVGWLAMSGKWR